MACRWVFGCCMLAGLAVTFCVPEARAHAVDGTWCSGDGRFLAIRGPVVVTPGGVAMEGNYGRHLFSYTVPSNEPGAGDTVVIKLLDDDRIELAEPKTGHDPHVEIWWRCAPGTSGSLTYSFS